MKYFTKKIDKVDGVEKVDDICRSATQPGEGWYEAPENWKGHHGMPTSWLDKDNSVIPEDKRVELGIQKDHRGTYYDKETGKETKITKLDKEPSDNLTKEKPLENELYQLFDKKKNKWIVDEKKKERAEKEMQLGQYKAEIADAEQRRIRSVLAINVDQTPNDDDVKYDKKFRERILELRPLIAKLKKELETA